MIHARCSLIVLLAFGLACSSMANAQQCAEDMSQIRGDVPILAGQSGRAFSMPIRQMIEQAGGAEFGLPLLQAQIDEYENARRIAQQSARLTSAANTVPSPEECQAGRGLGCLSSEAHAVLTEGILVNRFLQQAFACHLGVSIQQGAPNDRRIQEELARLQQAQASYEQRYQALLTEREITRQRDAALAAQRRREQWEQAGNLLLDIGMIGIGVLGAVAGGGGGAVAPSNSFRSSPSRSPGGRDGCSAPGPGAWCR